MADVPLPQYAQARSVDIVEQSVDRQWVDVESSILEQDVPLSGAVAPSFEESDYAPDSSISTRPTASYLQGSEDTLESPYPYSISHAFGSGGVVGPLHVRSIEGGINFPGTATGLVTQVARALTSVGNDTLRVEQQEVSQISAEDSGTGSGSAASLNLGDHRKGVAIHVDTSGSATLTVEVSHDGGSTWLERDTVDYADATVSVEDYTITFEDVRAHLDQNRNGVTVVSRGS